MTDESHEPERTDKPDDPPQPGLPEDSAGHGRWWRRGSVLLAAGVLITALAIAAAVLVITRGRDEATGAASGSSAQAGAGTPEAAEAFVAAASASVNSVTSYDYRSLDVALQSGLEVTTGSYRTAYRAALTGALADRARSERIVQTWRQTAAGIGTIASDLRSAKVLVFGVQSVRRGDAAAQDTEIALTATMVRQGDRYLIGQLSSGTNAGVPAGSPQVAVAAETARSHVIASLTLRRSSSAADYAAALADTIDPLRTELAASLQQARRAAEKGGYDLSGRVTAVAIEQAGGNRVVVLVAAEGYRVRDGESSVDTEPRLRVTAAYVRGSWRIADAQPVAG